MDTSKMSNADKIIGAGAIAGVVGCFLPWYSVFLYSVNGLNAGFWGVLAFLASLASLLVIGLPLMGQKLPELPIKENMLQMILGGVIAGGPIIQMLSTTSVGTSFGIFITVAGGALILFGSYQKQNKGAAPTAE